MIRELITISAACALVLGGCGDTGVCDEASALRVAVSPTEGPAYEGQALMIASCGYGSHCHSESADRAHLDREAIVPNSRIGAPHGLDFDLRLASISGLVEEERLDRLDRHQRIVFANRRSIWGQVSSGAMPPGGASAGFSDPELNATLPRYVSRETGAAIPHVATPAGREILRNWLACGSRVIERTLPPEEAPPVAVGDTVTQTCSASSDCDFPGNAHCFTSVALCGPCESDADCAHFPLRTLCDRANADPVCIAPIAPTWPAIHDTVIAPRCATAGCHTERAGLPAAGALDLDGGEAAAFEALFGVAAQGSACQMTGTILVAANDADNSLLVQKLEAVDAMGDHVCGEQMPQSGGSIPGQHVLAIREWIDAGATR